MARFRWLLVVLVGFSILLGGCRPGSNKQVPETQNKSYERGKRYLREDRKQEALDAFLLVIAESPVNAPESHLEAGRIYQDTLNDPVSAIYHYRKFLEQRPTGQETPIVRQMIESAKKDFAGQLPGNPFDRDADRLDLLKMLQEARSENEKLREELSKRQLAAVTSSRQVTAATGGLGTQAPAASAATSSSDLLYPQGVTTNIASGQTPRQAPPAAQSTTTTASTQQGTRSYRVEPGDTLTKISTRMYGTPSRWEDIFQANRNTLSAPHMLKVGQTLVIPQ